MTPPERIFTFSNPHTDFDAQACLPTNDSLPLSSSRSVDMTGGSTQPMPNDIELDPKLPAIPTSPPSAPEVGLPGSSPSESEEALAQAKSIYLHNFTIPSPLLYHSKSREDLLGIRGDWDHSSKEEIVLCEQDPSDPELESFKLGSPLQRLYDDCNRQTFSAARFNEFIDDGFPSFHDPAFYQRTRTYLTSPPRGSGKCPVTLASEIEHPIPTTTNTPSKRQTYVYPGEFALMPPARLPSSLCTLDCPPPSKLEQIRSATATVGNEYESQAYDCQIYTNAGLATPPPEPCGEQSLDLPIGIANTEYEGRRKRRRRPAKKTSPTQPHAQAVSPKGDNTCVTQEEPVQWRSGGMIAHDPEAGPQSASQSGDDGGVEIPTGSATESQLFGLSKPSMLGEKGNASHSHKSSTIRIDTSRATTRRSLLPVKIATPAEPISLSSADPPPTSWSATQPSSKVAEPPTLSDIDIVTIKACPTMACTALLILVPKTGELASDRYQTERRGPLGQQGGAVVEMATARFAEDLGFRLQHGEGCSFAVSSNGKKGGKEMGVQIEAGSDVVLHEQECAGMGGMGRKEETGGEVVHHGGGQDSAAAGEVEVDDEDEDEFGDSHAWEDDWVGEGAGLEFWV